MYSIIDKDFILFYFSSWINNEYKYSKTWFGICIDFFYDFTDNSEALTLIPPNSFSLRIIVSPNKNKDKKLSIRTQVKLKKREKKNKGERKDREA